MLSTQQQQQTTREPKTRRRHAINLYHIHWQKRDGGTRSVSSGEPRRSRKNSVDGAEGSTRMTAIAALLRVGSSMTDRRRKIRRQANLPTDVVPAAPSIEPSGNYSPQGRGFFFPLPPPPGVEGRSPRSGLGEVHGHSEMFCLRISNNVRGSFFFCVRSVACVMFNERVTLIGLEGVQGSGSSRVGKG